MAKKSRNYKPQKRTRLKPTTGQLEFRDVVYLDKIKDAEGVEQVVAFCTCDKWKSSDEATTITKVALEAKAHVDASNGKCRLRPHDAEPEDIQLTPEQIEKARETAMRLDAEAAEAEETE